MTQEVTPKIDAPDRIEERTDRKAQWMNTLKDFQEVRDAGATEMAEGQMASVANVATIRTRHTPLDETLTPSKLLKGHKAFITGGSRGIGKAMCEVFAREGADVAFNYNSNDVEAEDTVQRIEQHGVKAYAHRVSVTDGIAVKKMAKEAIEAFDGRIDILINNAAINRADSFLTTTEKAWRDVVDVNVHGLYHVTKPFFKQMLRQRSGKILNITSIGGIRALPTSVHYATTKAAVVGFTKCLSKEAGQFGVTVNGIAAGIFDTDLGHSLPEHFTSLYTAWVTRGRCGQPEELAEFAAFMVCPRNSYMTGEIVVLDGGAVV